MPNKYIDVRINEERFCTEGIAEFSLLNMDALNEDGYVVRWNAIQQIGRFFEENIFSASKVHIFPHISPRSPTKVSKMSVFY